MSRTIPLVTQGKCRRMGPSGPTRHLRLGSTLEGRSILITLEVSPSSLRSPRFAKRPPAKQLRINPFQNRAQARGKMMASFCFPRHMAKGHVHLLRSPRSPAEARPARSSARCRCCSSSAWCPCSEARALAPSWRLREKCAQGQRRCNSSSLWLLQFRGAKTNAVPQKLVRVTTGFPSYKHCPMESSILGDFVG